MKKFSIFLLAALVSSGALSSEIFSPRYAHCSDPELRIKSVIHENDVTKINLALRTTEMVDISLYPPGTYNSFFARDASTGEEYDLIGFNGVAVAPGFETYNPFQMVYMELIFNKIKSKKFHLIEGKQADREDFWTCMNINLE